MIVFESLFSISPIRLLSHSDHALVLFECEGLERLSIE